MISESQNLEKSHICDKCGRQYMRKVALNHHKRYECGIEPRFFCNFCGRKFKHKHHLQKHYRGVHNYHTEMNKKFLY